jgi:hypothetical protein
MREPSRRPPKLTPDGVPIDGRDWTEADWADLHYGMAAIKARIAARHASESRESGPQPGETAKP